MRRPAVRRSLRSCALVVVVAACGPTTNTGESTATDATAESTAASGDITSTGEPDSATGGDTTTPTSTGPDSTVCALEVGPREPQEADPDGCYAVLNEAGCEAKEEQGMCTGLFGTPVSCSGDAICLAEAAVYLGCRPFSICKMWPKLVCRTGPSGELEVYYTTVCVPDGFGECDPQPAFDGETMPPRCE